MNRPFSILVAPTERYNNIEYRPRWGKIHSITELPQNTHTPKLADRLRGALCRKTKHGTLCFHCTVELQGTCVMGKKEQRGMSYFESIRFRQLMLTIGLQMIVAVIFITAAMISSNKMLYDSRMEISESTEQSLLAAMKNWRTSTLAYAQMAADNPSADMVEAIQNKDTAKILELMRNAYVFSGCTGLTVLDMEGVALARSHEPESFGQNSSASLVIADGLAGRSVSYLFPSLRNGFAIAAGVPIMDGRTQIGVLFLVKRIDTPSTLREMQQLTGGEIVIYLGNDPVMASFTNDMESLGKLPEHYQTQLNTGTSIVDTANFNSVPAVWRYTPLAGRDGSSTVGTILTINTCQDGGWVITMWIVLFITVCVIVIPLALWNNKKIISPLITLSAFMHKAGTTGDITFTPEDERNISKMSKARDEMGQTVGNIAIFLKHVENVANELEAVAQGDLTITLDILSDKDTLGRSIQHTVDNLNSLFGDINVSSSRVSNGSKQIADGAHALAQGSIKQSASVDALSNSVAEIENKTKTNAAMAGKAAELANRIRSNAESGNHQMDKMISAVKDINQSSQNISNVIKIIDDIAFQTNILALNAAVEAARAGQHGKGFAVVAEEVRNLASKSADAARDTGNMIKDSMEKAELGSRIAGEAAASLTEIVSGINESNQLVAEIAKSSGEQSTGIMQIKVGIDQVAQVIQQNTATAEESAASSAEMSGQSDALRQLIARFKLKSGYMLKC